MALSAGVMLQGGSNVPLQLALWLLYHSIVAVGQRWYGEEPRVAWRDWHMRGVSCDLTEAACERRASSALQVIEKDTFNDKQSQIAERRKSYAAPGRYSFGWESQLLETGFLSIFLVATRPAPAPRASRARPRSVHCLAASRSLPHPDRARPEAGPR